MPLIQCRNCGKAFDASLVPEGAPLLCSYCGYNNSQPIDSSNLPAQVLQADQQNQNRSTGRVPSDWEAGWSSQPLKAYTETLKHIFSTPVRYFARIKPFDDYVSLAVFIYINSFFVILIGMGMEFLFRANPFAQIAAEFNITGAAMGFAASLCVAILMPAVSVLLTLIVAGILHFFLKYVGGSQKGFDTTFTVYGLSSAVNILSIVPIVGGLASLIYVIIINIGGQAEAHEIPPAKALLSVLLPLVICCCCSSLGIFFLGGFASVMSQ